MKRKRDAATFDKGNSSAASIILSGDPQTFGAGLVEWARRWTAGHPTQEPRRWQRATVASGGQAQQQEPEQLEMFERTEAA